MKPNWFWRNGGLGWPARLLKNVLASSSELRRNSNTVPCNWFVPAFVCTLTTAPAARPNSGEKLAVETLNSWMASITGAITTPPALNRLALLSTPSRMKLLVVVRCPLALKTKRPRKLSMAVSPP